MSQAHVFSRHHTYTGSGCAHCGQSLNDSIHEPNYCFVDGEIFSVLCVPPTTTKAIAYKAAKTICELCSNPAIAKQLASCGEMIDMKAVKQVIEDCR